MLSAHEIRRQFLDFFKSKGHEIVPSAPVVVKNDPTLLFTNSGMNQFKDYFLGNKKASSTRIADTQKCLRVSGKHNDLEEVGVDTYHHTMFEMLGNWSFGDYFKKEAIEWSWELLTEVYKIPKDKLYVTVFEGDAKENLSKDEEAWDLWKQFVPEDRILPGNKKDNFWEMGDIGPCGPCSEIHVDCRTEEERKLVDGATLVNADHPQVIEIWNNVFMQFSRVWDDKAAFDEWEKANKELDNFKSERAKKVAQFTKLVNLPAQHVDTGMGFERLVRVLQNKQSNYDTDVFTGTIASIETITGKKYDFSDTREAVAFRVLSDHIRAICFTIADGQLPSNTGAGYVIRRILRRAVRYYYSYLDYKQPLLHQLAPVLAKQFEDVFPELQQQLDFVAKVVKEEEDAFLRTLDKGLKRLDDAFTNAKDQVIEGAVAFELYDTYGFPIDLTRLIASENKLSVDEAGFHTEMTQQKNRSRAATALDTDDWIVLREGANKFVGYDSLEARASVLKYRRVKAKGKESYQIVLDQTPFYAESGGQVGDTGELIFGTDTIQIVDTKKENDMIVHFAERVLPDMNGGVLAKVDTPKRRETEKHHSATHLMQAALRNVLGTHVAQKGSLNNQEYLRFDFSHFAKMTDEEIQQVEELVNDKIRQNVPVVIKSMSKDEAVAMGAMALFGEKYGDVVRVVIMDPGYSIELCGGTHVGSTGEIGFFKIISEGALAAGVRRIEAVTGKAAEDYVREQLQQLNAVKSLLKNPKDLSKSVESLQEENTSFRKQLEALEQKQLAVMAKELAAKAAQVNGKSFIGMHVEVSSADALKKLCFDLRAANDMVVLTAEISGKASVAIGISDALSASVDAGKLIKEKVAPLIKGGGGGQKTLATAGGQDASQLSKVIGEIKSLL